MTERRPDRGEAPPILGSWRALYGVVLVWLAALIALFAAFSRAFR